MTESEQHGDSSYVEKFMQSANSMGNIANYLPSDKLMMLNLVNHNFYEKALPQMVHNSSLVVQTECLELEKHAWFIRPISDSDGTETIYLQTGSKRVLSWNAGEEDVDHIFLFEP